MSRRNATDCRALADVDSPHHRDYHLRRRVVPSASPSPGGFSYDLATIQTISQPQPEPSRIHPDRCRRFGDGRARYRHSAIRHGQNAAGIPLRPLGTHRPIRHDDRLGGYHSSVHPDENDSIRLIQRAVDEGITFLDNAWDYHDGGAEERMGKAISQGNRRDKVFLMTKCCGRTAKDAQSHLEDSLRRLRTDHLDLWQFHEIVYDNDPDWIFAKGARSNTRLKAKEEGRSAFWDSPATRTRRFI